MATGKAQQQQHAQQQIQMTGYKLAMNPGRNGICAYVGEADSAPGGETETEAGEELTHCSRVTASNPI